MTATTRRRPRPSRTPTTGSGFLQGGLFLGFVGAGGVGGRLRGGDVVELDEEMKRAAQDGVGPVWRRVGDQAWVLEPAGKLAERDLGFQPGEGGTEAVVDAAAETEVLVVV